MLDFLKNNNPIIIMEFANEERGNENHKKAEQLLQSLNYFPHKISKEGEAERLTENTSSYLKSIKLESDNIVYCK